MRRLLVLTCSARKRLNTEGLAALERYDGPQWQLLRRIQRDQPLLVQDVDIYAISAKYGFIPATRQIPLYEQKMTLGRALEIQEQTNQAFTELLQQGHYASCCLGLSQIYHQALGQWEDYRGSTVVSIADGPMGEKLRQIKTWLLGLPTVDVTPPASLKANQHPSGKATVAGVTIEYSKDDVLQFARDGIANNEEGIQRFRTWYVVVDNQQVAPKWLMSKLINRPTSDFSASDARRGLLALGIDIEYSA